MASDLEGANCCRDVLKQFEQEGGLIINVFQATGTAKMMFMFLTRKYIALRACLEITFRIFRWS